MKALRLIDGQLKLLENVPIPPETDGSVIVRVIQAGICETDLQLIAGYMKFSGTLGHEFVGVAKSGKYANQRVVGEINCACHQCRFCQLGQQNHCPHRTVIGILNHDGAFADYVLVPEANLHPVPDELTDDLATLVEPVAAAMQIGEQINLDSPKIAYVVGDGRLGNLCAQAIRQHGCQVTVVGKHPEKLGRMEAIGIPTRLLGELADLPKADLVIDCAGSTSGLSTAISLVRPRGTVVMKSTVAAEHSLSLASIVIDEITLVGSRCGPFAKAIEALQKGQFQLNNFVSGIYDLEAYQEAFECATKSDSLKVILRM